MSASVATSIAEASISVAQLTKDFGDVHALSDVSLHVAPGEIYTLLGANGAGKSTLMRCLLGYLNPTRGATSVLGGDSRDTAIRARIGYLPGDLRLPVRSRVDEILRFRAVLQRRAQRPATDTDELCQRLAIPVHRRFGTLSKGNRQKVGLALALMSSPDVLVLDEPTSGLDPLMQALVLDLVRERRDAGAAVLLSTHILSEATDIADRVGVLRDGSLGVEAPLSALLEQAQQSIEILLETPAPADVLVGVEGLTHVEVNGHRVHFVVMGSAAEVIRRLAPHGVRRITTHSHEFDEMFQQVSGDTP